MTTDNLPAVPEPEHTRALAQVDSWIPVLADVANLAEKIAGTEFVPRGLRDSAPAVAAAILYGREVGLPPMTALNVTHVIEGKPAISAEGMRAMVFAAGHDLVVEDSTGAQCIVKGRRRGSDEWTRVVWNIDMARAAGVAGKAVWQKYPRAMLQARASAELCRLVFPDVTHGFRAVEELDDTLEDGTQAPPPGPATRVTRKKAAAKKSTPAPLEQRPERPDQSGPPLPGEPGYETSAGDRAPGGGTGQPEDTGSEREDLATVSPAEPTPGGTGAHDEEQPEPSPTGAEEAGGETVGEAANPPAPEAPGPKGPRLANRAQMRAIFAALKDIGVDEDDQERHLIATTILGRPIESFKLLTVDDAKTLLDTFARVKDMPELTAVLDEFEAQRS